MFCPGEHLNFYSYDSCLFVSEPYGSSFFLLFRSACLYRNRDSASSPLAMISTKGPPHITRVRSSRELHSNNRRNKTHFKRFLVVCSFRRPFCSFLRLPSAYFDVSFRFLLLPVCFCCLFFRWVSFWSVLSFHFSVFLFL